MKNRRKPMILVEHWQNPSIMQIKHIRTEKTRINVWIVTSNILGSGDLHWVRSRLSRSTSGQISASLDLQNQGFFFVRYKHFFVFYVFLLVLFVQSQDFENFLVKSLVFPRFWIFCDGKGKRSKENQRIFIHPGP